MSVFTCLSDEHWAVFQHILPKEPEKRGRGMPRVDTRKALNSVLFILINGHKWSELPNNPDLYCSKSSGHRALQRWRQDGTLEAIKQSIIVLADYKKKINWSHASIDGSFSPCEGRRRAS